MRVKVINYSGKSQLLKRLPSRFKAYRDRICRGEPIRIVALVDRDSDECVKLKARLEQMARERGLHTKSGPGAIGNFSVVNRLAIEELEAWFLGDPDALGQAFTKLPASPPKGIFRNPDNVGGRTCETLHRFLGKHGNYRSSYPKIEAARRIAIHMDIDRNRSRSFQTFCAGVEALLR